MLSFFKINDPFRILGIALLLIALSLPYELMNIPLLSPELSWMLVGERLSHGHYLYVDIVDDIGPLSAYMYWLIDALVGRSWWMYKFLAACIILFQIYYVNRLFIQYKAFDNTSYIPALVMLVLFHFSFDMLTLSPALMGTTFIILALGQLFSQTLLNEQNTESILLVGLFGGVAVCFHFPLIIFLPFLLVAGITVSGFSFNQLILSLVGYFQPFVMCCIYFFWIGGLPEFITEFVLATRITSSYPHVTYFDLLTLMVAPLLFAVIGYFVGTVTTSITVNQQKQKQLMLLYTIFAIFSVFIANRRTPYQMVIILPGLTYFIAQIFIHLTNRKQLNALFYTFLLLIPAVGYTWTVYKIQAKKTWNYTLEESVQPRAKRIVILGDEISAYQHTKLASPYLNFRLSKRVLTDYADQENMMEVYLNFLNEKPTVIYDQEGLFEKLIVHIPALGKLYQKEQEGVFRLSE
ncbi:hypothetical protein [Echinicola rosea]|uniref:Glycosyltransferase RgtA/B/C/D-like domain-containing protein n=1 Tax=Echinicola rosea TaxID=1807691 RepID=A0ABQ1V191_9BACT|nr:hypothetical protein [Echinicola rosea]GGF33480.1 hypothetical protein GCM10011339_22120 [Echinicola rosea]